MYTFIALMHLYKWIGGFVMASYRLHPKGNAQGKYELTVCAGYDINGKKIRQSKIVTIDPKLTENKKEKILDRLGWEFEEEVKAGMIGKDSIKFIDFTLNVWKPNYGEKCLEITTLTRYMEFLESRIFPKIRTFKIKRYYSTGLNEIL